MNTKSILESKTFWLAVIQGVVGVLAVLITQYPTLGYIAIAKSIADVVLRLLTDQPIYLGGDILKEDPFDQN